MISIKWVPKLALKTMFIGVWLLYDVVLVSAVQQSESAACKHRSLLFWISFPFRSPQSIEKSSLFYQGKFSLVIYFIQSICVNPNLSIHSTPPPPTQCPYVCSLCLYFCFVNKMVYNNFFRFNIYALTYTIWFFSFWLNSFCMTVYRSIHISTNDPISFLFMVE